MMGLEGTSDAKQRRAQALGHCAREKSRGSCAEKYEDALGAWRPLERSKCEHLTQAFRCEHSKQVFDPRIRSAPSMCAEGPIVAACIVALSQANDPGEAWRAARLSGADGAAAGAKA